MSDLALSEVTPITRRSTPQSTPQSAGRILIIDDEAEIRESLETLLQLEGYTVAVAGSGREGLAQIGQRAFDVVLLDLALPDKNGMDVLSEIRLLYPQQGVIMITAYGTAPPTSSKNLGTTRSSWPTCALPSPVRRRKKKTFN
jgi:response regulator RpfG family c-di-GMP phosphodiesterase